mgnify:CR=1 FL=1
MALIVHKYGGTSMGSTVRIRNVAKRVAKCARAVPQMVVVPSAMSGEPNRPLVLAQTLAPAQPAAPLASAEVQSGGNGNTTTPENIQFPLGNA